MASNLDNVPYVLALHDHKYVPSNAICIILPAAPLFLVTVPEASILYRGRLYAEIQKFVPSKQP